MNFVDAILNFAALLLWASWRAAALPPPHPVGPTTLASTLKPTDSTQSNRWMILVALAGLLSGRSIFYWQVGGNLDWVPSLRLVVISLPFRSDRFDLMLAYSVLSFLVLIVVFYHSLLLLSAVNHKLAADAPWHRGVRQFLSWLEAVPTLLKPVLLPLIVAILWRCVAPFLYKVSPPNAVLWQQSAIAAIATIFAWKYLLLALFGLHLLNSYVYLGNQPLWKYVQDTSSKLLWPLGWLRFGRLDLSPAAGIAVVWLGTHFGSQQLSRWLEHIQ